MKSLLQVKQFLKNQAKAIIFLLIIIIIAEFSVLNRNTPVLSVSSSKVQTGAPMSDNQIQNYSSEVQKECESSQYKPTCYDEKISKLMDPPINMIMEDGFRIAKAIQKTDSSYLNCHVLGHDLSAKEYDKDPSKWKEIIPRCPFAMCANGCQHGVLQEVGRSESFNDAQLNKFLPDIADACEPSANWNPTAYEQLHCYHGVGHVMLYLTDGDMVKASNLCEQIGLKTNGKDYRNVCFQGLFMQLFQPLVTEDYELIKKVKDVPDKNSLANYCNQFDSPMKQEACWEQGWMLSRSDLNNGPAIYKYCAHFTDSETNHRCLISMYFVLSQDSNFDINKINHLCVGMPNGLVGDCLGQTASAVMQGQSDLITRAAELCNNAPDVSSKNECTKTLINQTIFTYHDNSSEYKQLCDSLTTPLKTMCI